jgi:ATP-dependent protease HslVU (ClpYQ) ATPase subunit
LEEVVRCILFINSGVFLVTEGSDILPHLRVLQERGVEIIISSACLEHYQLTDKIQIGSMANMFTITEKLMDSLRVITL